MAFTRRPVKQRPHANLPSIALIKAYLKKQGWTCDYDWQGKIEYHIHGLYPNEELKLTVDKSIKDYDKRLDKFFDELAELEYKKVDDLVREIKDLEKPSKEIPIFPKIDPPKKEQARSEVSDDIGQSKGISEGRLNNGQFAKGHHFSRLPKAINGSSICEYRRQMADHVPSAIVFVNEIKNGEHRGIVLAERQLMLSAAKSLIEYVVPLPKASSHVDIDLDDENLRTLQDVKLASARIIQHLGGSMSVEDIMGALGILQMHIKFIEMADIEPRMREIEQVINSQKTKG